MEPLVPQNCVLFEPRLLPEGALKLWAKIPKSPILYTHTGNPIRFNAISRVWTVGMNSVPEREFVACRGRARQMARMIAKARRCGWRKPRQPVIITIGADPFDEGPLVRIKEWITQALSKNVGDGPSEAVVERRFTPRHPVMCNGKVLGYATNVRITEVDHAE